MLAQRGMQANFIDGADYTCAEFELDVAVFFVDVYALCLKVGLKLVLALIVSVTYAVSDLPVLFRNFTPTCHISFQTLYCAWDYA